MTSPSKRLAIASVPHLATPETTPAERAAALHALSEEARLDLIASVRNGMGEWARDLYALAHLPSCDPVTRALCCGLSEQIDAVASRLAGIHGPLK